MFRLSTSAVLSPVQALWQNGFHDAIDVVYGSSAGSLIGAYFVAEQMPYVGPEIYYNELSAQQGRKKFVNRNTLLKYCGLGLLNFQFGIMNLLRDRYFSMSHCVKNNVISGY
jgi:hypothetical protein